MLMTKAVQEGRQDIVKYLLECGVEPDGEKALLHEAVKNDDLEMVRLVTPFCEINGFDLDGNTPLHLARSIPVAQWLVQHGARADLMTGQNKLPYEMVDNEELKAWLEQEYLILQPVAEIGEHTPTPIDMPLESRFMMRTLSIEDLRLVSGGKEGFMLEYEGEVFQPTRRFIDSFARKMKSSTNIFRLFSAEEVFERLQDRMPHLSLKTTFDLQENTVLGVLDKGKKVLPPEYAFKVLLQDDRLTQMEYQDGVWQAQFELGERFEIANDSPYTPMFWLDYPVDGLSNAAITLGMMREVCSNGAKATSRGFRTEIEVNDSYGLHLAKLLASYSNEDGFSALRFRLEAAQMTNASVAELQQVGALLSTNVANKRTLQSLLSRLEELAEDPCSVYKVTSLKNISEKKAKLLPVECSVNDLFIFCSELTTHHRSILRSPDSFYGMLGNMLSQEFDLEDMYSVRKKAPDFALRDMEVLRA